MKQLVEKWVRLRNGFGNSISWILDEKLLIN
jgi:hypothetical protein